MIRCSAKSWSKLIFKFQGGDTLGPYCRILLYSSCLFDCCGLFRHSPYAWTSEIYQLQSIICLDL